MSQSTGILSNFNKCDASTQTDRNDINFRKFGHMSNCDINCLCNISSPIANQANVFISSDEYQKLQEKREKDFFNCKSNHPCFKFYSTASTNKDIPTNPSLIGSEPLSFSIFMFSKPQPPKRDWDTFFKQLSQNSNKKLKSEISL